MKVPAAVANVAAAFVGGSLRGDRSLAHSVEFLSRMKQSSLVLTAHLLECQRPITWVPADVVIAVIEKHGGIAKGECPPLSTKE